MKKNNLENNRIHIYHEEANGENKKEKQRQKEKSKLLPLFFLWIWLFVLSLFLTISYNQWNFSIAWIMKYASLNIENFYHFLVGNGAANGMDARFYQYLIISLTGAALAACGTVFQGTFRNVLAGPSTMGVMAGGTLGCSLYLLVFATSTTGLTTYQSISFFEEYKQQFCILLGCFLAVGLVVGVSTIAGRGKISSQAMILSGMVLGTVVGNINQLIQYYMIVQDPEDTRIDAIKDMMMGNFTDIGTLPILLMMAVPIIICLFVLIKISGKLNLFSFGEDEARAMGVNVGLYRNLLIFIGTVLTAIVVAFCGHVGFVGFMVPLISRKIVGPDMRKLLPVSMLVGASLLIVIFDVAYFLGIADSMNVVTSSIGCLVMSIVLIRKGGKKGEASQRGNLSGMGAR